MIYLSLYILAVMNMFRVYIRCIWYKVRAIDKYYVLPLLST